MSWNGQGNMGPSPGGGLGGLVTAEMASGMQGNASNQLHATEYTLQGERHPIYDPYPCLTYASIHYAHSTNVGQ